MEFKIIILLVTAVCVSATVPVALSQSDKESAKGAEAAVGETKKVASDTVTVTVVTDSGVKEKEIPIHRAKSLENSAEEEVRLYRHDIGAGVYRTESGDLVRMYRVERTNPPMTMMAGPGRPQKVGSKTRPLMRRIEGSMEPGMEMPRQRMLGLGDWYSNYYGYGADPYNYNYNYNYGGTGYPYSSGYNYNYMYPYSYNNLSPYSTYYPGNIYY